MKLSVLMPARDEGGCIEQTLSGVTSVLAEHHIPFEIVVVDDGSSDNTAAKVRKLAEQHAEIRLVSNTGPHGFGLAIRAGLRDCQGDAIVIVMADGSDDPKDLVRYWEKIQEGYDCVFGTRFSHGGRVIDYPPHKLVINRFANWFIMVIFGMRYNDVTNAFKCYRRRAIDGMQPLISNHFNLTVEMPLKAIIRGYSYAIVPVSWRNRTSGISKLKIKEMGSRYLFIVLYLWLEKHLSRGDYHRTKKRLMNVEEEKRHHA